MILVLLIQLCTLVILCWNLVEFKSILTKDPTNIACSYLEWYIITQVYNDNFPSYTCGLKCMVETS